MKAIYTPYAVTVSDFASGPPSSPSSGDIWIGTNVDANGTRWQFQYNAGSSSAYKWEFIGGPPMLFPYHDPNAALNTFTSSGYTQGLGYTVYLDNSTLLTPGRAGDYVVRGSYLVDTSASCLVSIQPIHSAGGAGNSWMIGLCNGWDSVSLTDTPIEIAATDHVWLGLASSNPANVGVRWNAGGITPVRVS